MQTRVSFSRSSGHFNGKIITQRLSIRPYVPEDFGKCEELYANAQATKYYDYGMPLTSEQVSTAISKRGVVHFLQGMPFGVYSVFDKLDNRFLGQVDIYPTDIPGEVEVGCILFPEYQAQGIGTEAIGALLKDYIPALRAAGYQSNGAMISFVIATAHPDNMASNRLLSKLGMKFTKMEKRFGQPRVWYGYPIHYIGTENVDRTRLAS
ncbi:MAG: GNAT family N-acetyltransferase [Candidatus Obscuribacterales bacterium]